MSSLNSKDQNNKPVAYIYERDIDLLLVEELYASAEFQKWFSETIANQLKSLRPEFEPVKFLYAHHSVANEYGESDLIATYANKAGQKLLLMIEDKINAALMSEQSERYEVRGDIEKKAGRIADFTTILIAPHKYFGSSGRNLGFQTRVTYEQLYDWFLLPYTFRNRPKGGE